MFHLLTHCKLSLCLDRENNRVNSEHRELSRSATKVNLDTNEIGLEAVKAAMATSQSTRSSVLVCLEAAFLPKNYQLTSKVDLDHQSPIARFAILWCTRRYPSIQAQHQVFHNCCYNPCVCASMPYSRPGLFGKFPRKKTTQREREIQRYRGQTSM
jgi:hypothetical protein